MSSPSSPTLLSDVSSRRAERRAAWLTAVGCVVASVLVSASVGTEGATAMTGALAAAFVAGAAACLGLWHAGWFDGRHIRQLSWLSQGRWILTDAADRRWCGRLCGQTRVAGRWVWLRWRLDDGRSRCLLIAPGDIDAQDLRRLVVRLRIEGADPWLKTAIPAS